MGPQVNRSEVEHVQFMVDAASRREISFPEVSGSNLLYITGITNDMSLVSDEIFGPVVSVMPFKTFDHVLRFVKVCEFGLSAYLWTKDMKRIMRTVGELDFGEIYVNRGIGELPQTYHTCMKKCGLAREDGKYAPGELPA